VYDGAKLMQPALGRFISPNRNWNLYKVIALMSLIIFCVFPNSYANWYTGGSLLIQPLPYFPAKSNYIKLGSSKSHVLANGISINAGYKYFINKYILASEFDIGGFSDGDGNIYYQDVKHFVSASYYMAIKQKLGVHITPNVVGYGLLGFSENSIGDRDFATTLYFNKKQLSFLYGGGVEYYTKRDNKVALFAEFTYYTPTGMTLYSGGAKASTTYSMSTYGIIPQFGMRYYF
jgi:hypothetical protein